MCNNPKLPMTTFSRLIVLCSFCLQPSVMHAIQKDSISIVQYVRDSFLTSSLRTPKIFVKEFSDFLMSCHQHCLGVNLLVQR